MAIHKRRSYSPVETLEAVHAKFRSKEFTAESVRKKLNDGFAGSLRGALSSQYLKVAGRIKTCNIYQISPKGLRKLGVESI
jgi:hypothetical protein